MSKYANEFAPRDGKLRVLCLHHEQTVFKADSYLFELDGQLWLLDGGMKNSHVTHEYLVALRRRWLESAGLDESSELPLKLDWFVSHFHIDHVSVMIEQIIPDARFELGTLYLPPVTVLDPAYCVNGTNGDAKYRPLLAKALKKYGTGKENIVQFDFGMENIKELYDESGKLQMTVYPPLADAGIGEPLEYNINEYWGGDRTYKAIPTVVVNSNSNWLKLRYGSHSFLFTGDTMKREAHLDKESTNQMVEAYHDIIGNVNVIKHVHHGYRRDDAVGLMLSFEPQYIILSCREEGVSRTMASQYPDATAKIQNCAVEDILFETDGETLTVNKI
ncbi:MAG: hypothetical protein IJY27_04920 [Clostridia bacterium]|nr:hypothetical protein [Clostridia bacterium]